MNQAVVINNCNHANWSITSVHMYDVYIQNLLPVGRCVVSVHIDRLCYKLCRMSTGLLLTIYFIKEICLAYLSNKIAYFWDSLSFLMSCCRSALSIPTFKFLACLHVQQAFQASDIVMNNSEVLILYSAAYLCLDTCIRQFKSQCGMQLK